MYCAATLFACSVGAFRSTRQWAPSWLSRGWKCLLLIIPHASLETTERLFSYLRRPGPARSCQTTAGHRERCRCGTELWTPPPSLPLDSAGGSTSPAGSSAQQQFSFILFRNGSKECCCCDGKWFHLAATPLLGEHGLMLCCRYGDQTTWDAEGCEQLVMIKLSPS